MLGIVVAEQFVTPASRVKECQLVVVVDLCIDATTAIKSMFSLLSEEVYRQ
jgi:hypothetical protein